MSDSKTPKKVFGRGRGKPIRSEGPWARSKKLDETHDVRPPKKDGEEFVLSESSFPPLPGAVNTIDDQFEDNADDAAGTSQLNGGIAPDGNGHGKKLADLLSNRHTFESNKNTEKAGEVGEEKSIQEVKNVKDEKNTSQEPRPKVIQKDKIEFQQNGNSVPTLIKTDNHHTTVDITNSNLSPFAMEFVPRGLNMNPEAQDFVPIPNANFDETNNNRSSTSTFNVNDTAAILADLEETVNFCYSKLIETPASYDELIGVVTPHFIKYMEHPDLPSEIVQILYNYAIQDTRFAYFAIKILIHLIKMTCNEDYTQLRDTLLRHTQEEVQNTQNFRLTNPEISCINDIQPFLMFLSELYIQLEVGDKRLAMVGSSLVETLKKLLVTAYIPLKERLRLIVNIIKLTGLSLDQDNSTFLDSLFTELGVILEQESSNLDNPTVQFVNDIILLRNLRWGLVEPELGEYIQGDSELPSSPNGNHAFAHSNGYDPTFDSNMVYASGVFYGPDGNPIDYEEQLFLEVETNALSHLQIGDQGEPSPTSVEGYDEAYEEFLKTVPGRSSE